MSINAGNILHVGGNNVIDRIQSAGLGNPNQAIQTIREVGQFQVVDKIPGEPEFTFSLESLDVSTDIMAFLNGKAGSLAEPGGAPGAADAAGTEYRWDTVRPVTIVSPWKDPKADLTGDIQSGHIIPAYWPTRATWKGGVTENWTQTVELAGGQYYYGPGAPVEEVAVGALSGGGPALTADFVTSEGTVAHRLGGPTGTTFRYVFGVIVDKVPQVEGIDYTVSQAGVTKIATIHFLPGHEPAVGAVVRFSYFTTVAKQYAPAVHASAIVKPGAVRGRNIPVFLGSGGARQRIGLVQSIEVSATIEGAAEYEMGTEGQVGRVQNGTDATGTLTVRARDGLNFLGLLQKVTGVAAGEVIGYLNQNPIPLEIPIENPKNPGTIIKTLYVPDAIFDIPGTPARVNTPVDFTMSFNSQTGVVSEFKGAKP